MKHPESHAQQIVVQWLRKRGIHFCAIPNGGKRGPIAGRILKAEGVVAGAPDIMIFDRPPARPECVGVALEMKAPDGTKPSKVQLDFLWALDKRGWAVVIAYGAHEAFDALTKLGFGGLPK